MPACPPSRTPATAPHGGWMGGCLHVACVDRCFGLRSDAVFECVAVWHSALCCVFGCPHRVAVCDSVQVMHKQRVHSHAATHTFLQPASVPPHARAPDQVKISNFENAQVGGSTVLSSCVHLPTSVPDPPRQRGPCQRDGLSSQVRSPTAWPGGSLSL